MPHFTVPEYFSHKRTSQHVSAYEPENPLINPLSVGNRLREYYLSFFLPRSVVFGRHPAVPR